MTRARVAALALVNWKGVFYERYLLDRHVTALEGANGAGKTTVMIAAYVVLLPDMTKLRFTNLGESGAIGGDRGIYGRLGEAGRPSYTVLDLEVAGERILAGVRLVRASEPTVEPTAFLVTNLGPDVRLADILLVRQLDGDHVPQLDELAAQVERAGGQLEVFRTIKDYFAALFDRGITPMRLATDEERGKLNEMLRTSMTGGISRALTSELRGFLLKEETGLSDTLSRMRANLEACRRTRAEVSESRQLEREITAIYEAGADMFAAAVNATRLAASEAEQRVSTAQPAVDDAVRTQRERQAEILALESRERELESRRAAARTHLASVTAERDRRVAVDAVTFRLSELDRELAGLAATAAAARARQAVASAERTAAKHTRAAAREAYDRASLGLAHLQQGLDELVRRAHAHRQLERRLSDARTLRARDVTADTAAAALVELDAERTTLSAERAGLERELADLEARRGEHAAATAALAALAAAEPAGEADLAGATEPNPAPTGAPPDHPYRHARALLARLAERDALLARAHELERDQLEAERTAARQQAARALAAELGLTVSPGPATAIVVRALDDVEQAVREAEDAARPDGGDPQAGLDELRARLTAIDDRLVTWLLASQSAHRLADAGPLRSRAELLAVRDRILEDQRALAVRRTELEATREQTRLRAQALERSGTATDPELARLRDELGGELLAERFEDLDVEAASWVEARLGPLAGALIVDDPAAAARAIAGGDRAQASIWLVAAGSPIDVHPGPDAAERAEPLRAPADDAPSDDTSPGAPGDEVVEARAPRARTAPAGDANAAGRAPGDVIVREAFGVRVTRRAERPALGRRARERLVAELHAAVARDGDGLDELTARAGQLAAWRRDIDQLTAHAEAWLAGDPTDERARLQAELASRELAATAQRERIRAAHQRATEARKRRDALRRLLGDAALLDGPDHAARAAELATARAQLAETRAQLARIAADRATLTEHVEILRRPPLDDAALAAHRARTAELAAALDRGFLARAALEDVIANRHAAAWGDAEQALAAQSGLAPALERQHADARAAAEAAEAAETASDATWEAATTAAQEAEAARVAAGAHRERAAGELVALGGAARSTDDHEQLVAAAIDYVNTIEADLRGLVTAAALATERRDQAARAAEEARARLTAETKAAGPAAGAWAELRTLADAEHLLSTALAAAPAGGRTSVQLTADAWSKREVLLDRVTRARGGGELADVIRALPLDGPSYLAAWQQTRTWLRHRVPVQVVEVDEPLLALERLRSHLDVLEGRLARQENDLRGASEDVARGIDIQLRRAGGQVRRLNQTLEGISFGSVRGIRVELRRIDRMEQILRALRLGEAQELLFLSSIPIEEALDEIFRRYGGGRAGGERLLDYREYLELAVQIRRQTAAEWESASPTRLSTGEAIGVGAAVMMVVLTEWERDANLLRARRTSGSLRFLFLDEANRLSRDNLGVLFDLCKTLDLQLLIAAPEVARAEGNTTYRLVRHVTDDGREEVLVTGRRGVALPDAAAAPEAPDPDALSDAPAESAESA